MTDRNGQGKGCRRAALRPPLMAVAFACLLSLIATVLGVLWYQQHLVAKQRLVAATLLGSKGHALTQAVDDRLALLEGLAALAEAAPTEGAISEQFTHFATGLTGGSPSIRNFALAPGGVIRYVYPLKGNEQALGLDLLHDPANREDAMRALNRGTITVTDPFQLRQGGLGLVARKAIRSKGGMWGLASMAVDIPTILGEAGISHEDHFALALSDRTGKVFYGDPSILDAAPVFVHVPLPEGHWELAAVPKEGWEGAIKSELLVFTCGSLFAGVLFGLVIFQTYDRQRRLHLEVLQRTYALSESEEYNRNLFELSPIGLALSTMDGALLDVNPAFAAIVGRTPAEAGTLSYWDITPEKHHEQDRLQMQSLEEAGSYGPYEKEFLHRDGRLVAVRLQGRIIERKNQRFIWSSVEDVTARKRLEEDVKERNEVLTLFAEHSPAAIAMLDRDMKYVIVSRRWLEDFNLGDRDITGVCHYDIFKELPESYREDHQRCLAGATVRNEEDLVRRPDGSMECIRREVLPWRSGSGEIGGILLFSESITERKRAEAAIRREHAFSQALIDGLPGVVYLYDQELKFIRWNKNFERVVGFSAEEISGMSPIDFFTGVERKRLQSKIQQVFKKGAASFEADFAAKDGTRTPYFFTGVRTEIDERVCLIGIGIDISERKRLEEELKTLNLNLEARVAERTKELQDSRLALVNLVEDLNEKSTELVAANEKLKGMDRLKSMFIASMSHELRTPLNSVIGYSSVLLNEWLGPVSAEQKEHLAIVLRAGKHLLSLINDVIDISKIEAGQAEVQAVDFDLHEVIQEACQQLEAEIRGKGLSLRVDNLHLPLRTDRRRLLQAVLNLVSNAMKYTIEGSIEVAAREAAGWVDISVADTGIGIAEQDAPLIFRPFMRIDSQLRIAVPGTGLGLYLTKRLATEMLEGTVFFTSSPGAGSIFTLRIPSGVSAGMMGHEDKEGRGSGEGRGAETMAV